MRYVFTMESNMEQEVDILMAKVLSGAAASAEQEQLEQWLSADPARLEEFERAKNLWIEADDVLASCNVDLDAAWARVAQATSITEEPVKQTKLINIRSWFKVGVAAAVLLAGLFLYRFFSPSDGMMILEALDQNISLVLPDQSQVTLRKGAVLKYPKQFAGNERRLNLEGEAFFEVVADKAHPFVVTSEGAEVKVLGTSFNLFFEGDEAEVTVATGTVMLVDRSKQTENSIILSQGKKGRLKKGVISTDNVSSDNYLYWKTGKLSFRSEPFSNVIKELEEIGHANISFDPGMTAAQTEQLIDISFKDQELEEMLSDICLITHCEWSREDDGYTVRAAN